MESKRQKFLLIFESCPTFMIFCFFIIKRVYNLIIFYYELSWNVWNAKISFRIIFYYWIETNWCTTQTYQPFNFFWIFWAKPCDYTPSERMIYENSIFRSFLFNNLTYLLTCIVHWYIKQAFLIFLLT